MAAPKVLDVGNCGPDHGQIARLLRTAFGAESFQTEAAADTLARLKSEHFDLVLINRKLDIDYTDGIEVLKQIKQDPQLASIPVMLITNYEEHQAAAMAHGALLGFGKLELNTSATREKLAAVLAPVASVKP